VERREVQRPAPLADELSEPYWTAAAEGRFVIQRCRACGTYHHPPVGLCVACLGSDLAFEPVSGRGRIRSFTVCHSGARHPFFESIQPYALALVELREQADLFVLCNPVGVANEALAIGQEVEVVLQPLPGGGAVPQFRVIS
jgi:hypothetical protein